VLLFHRAPAVCSQRPKLGNLILAGMRQQQDREPSRLAARRTTPGGLENRNVREQWGPLRAGTARGPVSLTQPCVGKSSCACPSTAVRACGGREPGTHWCLGAIHPTSMLPAKATRKPLRGEGRRKKDECRKGRQSHAKPYKPNTSHMHATSMRSACGAHAGCARV
jgi:hypothetical protein